MDVASLYTNIDHEEGADACFEKLEQRKNKTIPSKILKSLIMLVLKCNVFRFGSVYYEQIMGTCMGTPMAPNYANLFMDKFENEMIESYLQKKVSLLSFGTVILTIYSSYGCMDQNS